MRLKNKYQIADYYNFEEFKSKKPISKKLLLKHQEAKEHWNINLNKILDFTDKIEGKGIYDNDPYTENYKRELGYLLRDLKEEQQLLDKFIMKINKKLI